MAAAFSTFPADRFRLPFASEAASLDHRSENRAAAYEGGPRHSRQSLTISPGW